jgi:hypothetical protein
MVPQVPGRWRRGRLGVVPFGLVIGVSAAQAEVEASPATGPGPLPQGRDSQHAAGGNSGGTTTPCGLQEFSIFPPSLRAAQTGTLEHETD